MIAPPTPANEAARLAALERYHILDTAREEAYDDFTELAAHICGTPMALISLIDGTRQWFKSRVGLDLSETPRAHSFCAHAIVDNRPLVVQDAAEDARFHGNPLVTGDPRIRFYAGAPIVTSDGHGLGTICVLDRVPRVLEPGQLGALEALSRRLMSHLELRRSMVALREAEQSKKVFVSHASHELRTPLTSIRGAISLVLEGGTQLDEDARELMTAAFRNTERLLGIVNDMLDLERLGSGEIAIEPGACDLGVVLKASVEAVRAIARIAGVSIVAPPCEVRMWADGDRLSQVLINVIANAVRYSPAGGEVRVNVEPRGERVIMTVDDQGPGVPPQYRESIFEPFKQVQGSAAHKRGGTGLGLTISRAIVEMHQGTIVVGNAPGGGARFTIDLPLRA